MAAGGESLECRDETDHERRGPLRRRGHRADCDCCPQCGLERLERVCTIDVGVGLGLLGREKYGTQEFGGHVQLVLTTALQIHPISHAFAGFRLQHFSDAGIYGC